MIEIVPDKTPVKIHVHIFASESGQKIVEEELQTLQNDFEKTLVSLEVENLLLGFVLMMVLLRLVAPRSLPEL